MNTARIDDRDWSALTRGEQLYQIEVEGYLLMPGMLSPDEVRQLKSETARLETFPMPYSVHQRDRVLQPGHNPYPGSDWEPYRFGSQGGAITDLIAHEPMVQFLERMFGDEVVFMTYLYARSEPGHPGISLHTDGQPYGSEIFGYECSCPVMVKVLYYLDDLTPDVSPFSVLPPVPSVSPPSGQPLPALPRPSGLGDGHRDGRIGPGPAPPRLPRHLRQRGKPIPRDVAIGVPSGLVRTHPGEGSGLGPGGAGPASVSRAALIHGPERLQVPGRRRSQAGGHGQLRRLDQPGPLGMEVGMRRR